MHSLFCGEVIQSNECMDYFEQEAKKNGLLAKCTWKIPKAIDKGIQQ